uniref:SGNH domain-containing protein n=1 Tax=Ciona savignyi TaxID=51511 RepID=H2YPC3_CIOSA
MEYRSDLCAGKNVTFQAYLKRYYNTAYSHAFKQLVEDNVGRDGSLIIVSIGFHEQFNFNAVAWRFLEPAVRIINNFYRYRPTAPKRWPQIMYSLPMRSGLLKPTDFVKYQPEAGLILFEKQMRIYCRQRNIEVLDFQELGENVYSYDGVHYDLAVNELKNQILLNYIAASDK